MNDSLMKRLGGRNHEPASSGEQDEIENCGAFGWLRGSKDRAVMLELRKRTGNIRAIPYGWLEGADFDPSVGITLHIKGQHIRIAGRNLNSQLPSDAKLFHGIARHRVLWIQEAEDTSGWQAGTNEAVIIERIDW